MPRVLAWHQIEMFLRSPTSEPPMSFQGRNSTGGFDPFLRVNAAVRMDLHVGRAPSDTAYATTSRCVARMDAHVAGAHQHTPADIEQTRAQGFRI